MAINITISRIQLVRESTKRYNLSRSISNPGDVVAVANEVFGLQDEAQEVMIVIMLDTKHKIAGVQEISRGTASASIIHPREVLKPLILCNTSAFILCHNHPSGSPESSTEDRIITARLAEIGKLVDIPLLDHVILGEGNSYESLKEQGVIA